MENLVAEFPTTERPLVVRMNPALNGRRLDDERTAAFVLGELVGLADYDWIYQLLDSEGSIWHASVSIFSDKLWLLVDENGVRHWAEQPYPTAGESWRT
jgi:hypothetical protein